jgi:signal recognition particle receptor subunit beta
MFSPTWEAVMRLRPKQCPFCIAQVEFAHQNGLYWGAAGGLTRRVVTMSSTPKILPENSVRSLLNKQTAYGLGEIRNALLRLGTLLSDKLDERVTWLINDTLKRLEQNKARIAFIGQVKAGKSSVINALMKRPDFLPTDVNPSTAVITKVHFGSLEHPANTALFHFFTEEEWEQLFAAAEITDPDEPAFARIEATRRSLEVLRQRAQERLGPQYSDLIGKHHLFSAVTPEIMQSYVSTGDFSNKTAVHGLLFSDVTRMAEVFLDQNPIYYPSVLIDTPGVNDLFFVRDEITRANLADADVYVLVLTAHEPLSRSDISLLRLLRGLRRSRIIAVINRIDTLSNIAASGASLKEQVAHALKRELPYADIPVILVSALWANAALKESPFAIEGLITPRFISYASHCGAGNLIAASPGRDPDEVLGRYTKALYTCSGLSELADGINRMVAASIVEEELLPSSSTLAAICHNSAVAGRYCMSSFNLKDGGSGEPPQTGKLRGVVLQSGSHLKLLIDKIEHLLRDFRNEWKLFCEAELLNLERYLLYAVEQFASTQAFNLFTQGRYQVSQEDLFESTLNFRSNLATMICKSYAEVSRLLLDKQREAEWNIRRQTKEIMPEMDNILHFGMRPSNSNSIYLMPLAKATTFEMDNFWQQEIISSSKSYEAKAKELKLVMISEFYPIIKDVTNSANAGFELTIDDIIKNLKIYIFSSLDPILKYLNRVEDLCNSAHTDEALAGSLGGLHETAGQAVELFEKEHTAITDLKKTMFSF